VTSGQAGVFMRLGTILVMLNLTVVMAYWAGQLSQRVSAIEGKRHSSTADRWTKRDDDARHQLVMHQLTELKALAEKTNTLVEKMQASLWMSGGEYESQ